MNRDESYDAKLRQDLGELRNALSTLRAPELDEARLRAAFEARGQARAAAVAAAGRAARGVGWRAPLAVAASVAVAVLAVLLGLSHDGVAPSAGSTPQPTTQGAPAAPAAADSPGMTAAAFQPLMYSPGFSPSGSYNVLRVRIPLASLAAAQGADVGGSIEADLLVGEDGLARGIRFDSADTLFVSTSR